MFSGAYLHLHSRAMFQNQHLGIQTAYFVVLFFCILSFVFFRSFASSVGEDWLYALAPVRFKGNRSPTKLNHIIR